MTYARKIITSVNVGLPRDQTFGDKTLHTAIAKKRVEGPAKVTEVGFENDGVGNPKRHGGFTKAICAIGVHTYDLIWKNFDKALPVPSFGENLTVENLYENQVCSGDIYIVGTARLKISALRLPCLTLSAFLGDDRYIDLIKKLGAMGFYLSVLVPGVIEQGDEMILVERIPFQHLLIDDIHKALKKEKIK